MKILIVGAGIAGLLMYRELQRQGIEADLIEKQPALNNLGAGICLPGNAMKQLEVLGLKHAILAKAYQVKEVRFETHQRELLAKASLNEGVLASQPFVALTRSDLIEVLADGISQHIQFCRSIVDIRNNNTTQSVCFNDGAVVDYDLIIGADGINSSVRELQFAEPDLTDLEVTHWRFLVDMPSENLEPSYLVGNTDAFMFYPISKQQVYCYGQAANQQINALYSDPKKSMRAVFSHYHPSVVKAIESATVINQGRLRAVMSKEVYNKRCVLIGDALHGCPPSLQQGVAQALSDVLTLSRCLKNAYSIDMALADFKSKRLKQITWVVSESNKIIRLAKLGKSRFGRFIRNSLIRLQGPQNVKAWRKLMTELEANKCN
ncbi:FAD-dependent monooxygenase [Pseudoalteromonas sp. G4]|uniref:FAD-dependent monooxygenase n=1 Tax=Pseudoalteromonas sp. G4 TaxID=2992761 RepID=UPI00237E08A3|nr:FAD-dependent monooxygenase [Pseudoalteromonas sp. G4]MDE3270855.1 FAD-dependent monooxygenase [Pseudoalteromonas sp. G4]